MAKYQSRRKYEDEPEVIKVKAERKPIAAPKADTPKPIVRPTPRKNPVDKSKIKIAVENAVIASKNPMGGMVPTFDFNVLTPKLKDIYHSASIDGDIITASVVMAISENAKVGGPLENVIILLRKKLEDF